MTVNVYELPGLVPADCQQDGVCAFAPGCTRHWEERNRELLRERDEARALVRAFLDAWDVDRYRAALTSCRQLVAAVWNAREAAATWTGKGKVEP